MFRKLISIIFLVFLSSGLVQADLESAKAAYDAGEYDTALELLIPLAEAGDAIAQHNLGVMYRDGFGVPQDNSEAVKWTRKAAEQGYAEAQYNLGKVYQDGLGIPQDYTEALKWYRKAAEQGLALGQATLGVMYIEGFGVEQDYTEAVKWCRKAAEQGLALGQANLGVMYHLGHGLQKNNVQAYAWVGIAAANGDANAIQMRDFLETQLTPNKLEEARELARELWEKYGNKNNN